MNFEVWPEAIELGRMFAAEGYELALVGGPVRDLLLHRKSHDLDFCTSARPEQFEHILRRFGHDGFWDMGRKFGTLGAMRRREDGTEVKVEVTCATAQVEQVLAAIRRAHPYEEPVVNVIPLYRTSFQ